MKASVRRLSAIALLVHATPAALGAQKSASTSTCAADGWTAPRLIDVGAAGPFEITKPAIASGPRGDLYVVGRGPVVYSDSGLYLDVPFVALVVHPNGTTTRLGKPPFGGEFYAPRIGVSGDGLQVSWGEPDSTAAAPAPRARYQDVIMTVKGIWASTYAAGRWSPPRLAAASFSANWHPWATGWARPDWSPAVQFAFAGLSRGRWTIGFLNAHGTPAGIGDLDVGMPPLATTLLSPAPSQLVLGYVANDPSAPGDKASVFAVRSTDGGRSWGAPVRIAQSGPHPARDLALVRTPDGLLHAVWARTTSGMTFGAEVVGYAVSRDTGRTWSAPQYWDARGTFLNLKAAADRHGRIHIVNQATLPDGIWPTLAHASRTATGSWSRTARLFGDTLRARAPELATTASGEPVLVFATYLGMNGKYPVFASAVSYLRDGRACTSRTRPVPATMPE